MPAKETLAGLSIYTQKFRELPQKTQTGQRSVALALMSTMRAMIPGASEETLGEAAYVVGVMLSGVLSMPFRDAAEALDVSMGAYLIAAAAFLDLIDLSTLDTPEPPAPPATPYL